MSMEYLSTIFLHDIAIILTVLYTAYWIHCSLSLKDSVDNINELQNDSIYKKIVIHHLINIITSVVILFVCNLILDLESYFLGIVIGLFVSTKLRFHV